MPLIDLKELLINPQSQVGHGGCAFGGVASFAQESLLRVRSVG